MQKVVRSQQGAGSRQPAPPSKSVKHKGECVSA